MAESVVGYLEKSKDLVIREAVFDFTIDYDKTPWLINMKMVRYDNQTALPIRLTE
jgi:hypothetical protein